MHDAILHNELPYELEAIFRAAMQHKSKCISVQAAAEDSQSSKCFLKQSSCKCQCDTHGEPCNNNRVNRD